MAKPVRESRITFRLNEDEAVRFEVAKRFLQFKSWGAYIRFLMTEHYRELGEPAPVKTSDEKRDVETVPLFAPKRRKVPKKVGGMKGRKVKVKLR